MPCALVEIFAAGGQSQHGDDLDSGSRDGEHVGVEGAEAQVFESERKVAGYRRGRDIGYEADEVESPHGGIAPSVLDVLEGGWLFDGGEALGGIVTEKTLEMLDIYGSGIGVDLH